MCRSCSEIHSPMRHEVTIAKFSRLRRPGARPPGLPGVINCLTSHLKYLSDTLVLVAAWGARWPSPRTPGSGLPLRAMRLGGRAPRRRRRTRGRERHQRRRRALENPSERRPGPRSCAAGGSSFAARLGGRCVDACCSRLGMGGAHHSPRTTPRATIARWEQVCAALVVSEDVVTVTARGTIGRGASGEANASRSQSYALHAPPASAAAQIETCASRPNGGRRSVRGRAVAAWPSPRTPGSGLPLRATRLGGRAPRRRRWTRGRERHQRRGRALEHQWAIGQYMLWRARTTVRPSQCHPRPGSCALPRGSPEARRVRTQRDAPRRRSTTLPRAPRQLQTQARSRRVSADALVLTSALNAALKRTTASARRDSVRKQKAATGGGAAACCSLSLYLGEPARDMFVVDPSTTQRESFVYNLLHPDTVEIKVHLLPGATRRGGKNGDGVQEVPETRWFRRP